MPAEEFESLDYMDWKSGGDTNFAPIATADGELDCRGFWSKEQEHPDKDARFTSNADDLPDARATTSPPSAPGSGGCAPSSSSRRTARPRCAASTATTTTASTPTTRAGWCASWLELTDNPDSYMLLMESGPDGLPDPATEVRVPLHRGARFVVDTQRLWHVVVHEGDAPRYALITSFESGPDLERWIESQLPTGLTRTRQGPSDGRLRRALATANPPNAGFS